ncbi:MAG: hypothetical protein WA821_14895 [Anaerolineales bacterium]
MAILEMINEVLKAANNLLDFVFFWGGLLLVLGYPVYFFVKGISKNRKAKPKNPTGGIIGDLVSQTFILFILVFVAGVIWCIPEFLLLYFSSGGETFPWAEWIGVFTLFRWVELSGLLFFVAHMFGHENGETRWMYSTGGHIAVVFAGLIFFNRWVGLLFFSVPVLAAYYFSLYNMAVILLPASNPEDRAERWKRFVILAAYAWGIQFPLIVVGGHAWAKLETRIPGDASQDYPVPGLVWTHSHQVVAITGGTKFKRLDGPGVVFTGKAERPFQVFDLRLQTRTNEIEVVSKDGISFKARVVAAFRLDADAWDQETYEKLRRLNPILRGADKPSYTLGSFPFSHLRIQATLGVTSSKAAAGDHLIYWDQWVLNVVEDAARKVLSQKNLDELWRPAKDEKFANALDKIADEIKANASLTIRSAGILLLSARVVNFSFPGEHDQVDDISKQQITTWSSEWEGKSSNILAEAQAESEYAQQEARAYAQSVMLNAIAEGLQQTQEIDPNLPRYVIAMRFLNALQDFVHQQPDDRIPEELQNHLRDLPEQFFRNQGKEK